MKKEQVLNLCVNEDQKKRVEASFSAAEKTGKSSRFEKATSNEEAIKMIEELDTDYKKHKAEEEKKNKLYSLVDTCLKLGATSEEITEVLDTLISDKKEEYNKKIQEKIAALTSKLI